MAPPRYSFFQYLLFSCFLLAATTTRSLDAAGAPQLQRMICSTEGNYTAGDAYAANLNQLLAALPSTTVSKNGGFFNGSVGVPGAEAVVYGLAMCSADFSRQDCTDCLTAASSNGTGLVKRCPGSVKASIMFDQCMIRYSNSSFFGNNENDIAYSWTSTELLATRKPYSDNLKQGLAYLSAQAAMSPERFAASSTAPFALVQCTWDLPSDKCKACIDTLSANASNLVQVGIEGKCKSYSCFLRYSNASFTVVPLVAPSSAGNNNQTGPPSSVDTRISSKAIVAGAVTGSVVVVGSIIAVLFCLVRKRQLPYHRLKKERKEGGVMSLDFLNEITSNFSDENILGVGAFGKVYKGVLYGREIAAVKRLSSFDTEALKRELNNLSGLNHQNIVQLLGYCYETTRALHEEEQEFVSEICIAMIFEYMHKGSLETYLQDESEARSWKADYKIIKGTCEGLRYLHKGLKSPMLHLDIKPSNILLSNNMVPKLADFGLSTKLVSDNLQTQDTQRPFGTRGYLPPEYVPGKDVSKEFDIFGLGVVMLDIISGPEGYKKKQKMTSFQEFIDYVEKNWRKRLQARRTTTINKQYEYQVKRCLEIAMDCVNADPTQRPSIDVIISKLEDTENNTKKKTNIENSATSFTSQNEA